MEGDVLFIPPARMQVGILGEINRPGIYELKKGESVEMLIEYAGTMKPTADSRSIEIQRIDLVNGGFELIKVDNCLWCERRNPPQFASNSSNLER